VALSALGGTLFRRPRRVCVSVSQHPLAFLGGNYIPTPHPLKLGSNFEVPGLTGISSGGRQLRDKEPNRLMQALKRKKQTATMKRRALKPKTTKQLNRVNREFSARVQIEQSAP
jgi:hypothetical protein